MFGETYLQDLFIQVEKHMERRTINPMELVNLVVLMFSAFRRALNQLKAPSALILASAIH